MTPHMACGDHSLIENSYCNTHAMYGFTIIDYNRSNEQHTINRLESCAWHFNNIKFEKFSKFMNLIENSKFSEKRCVFTRYCNFYFMKYFIKLVPLAGRPADQPAPTQASKTKDNQIRIYSQKNEFGT